MRAVADTSSIIHPAKVRPFWEAMKNSFEEILIPEAVHEEILRGRDFESTDIPVIENAINDGWIKIAKPKLAPRLGLPENLGNGEKQAITLMVFKIGEGRTKKEGIDRLLMDDEIASKTARSMGLTVRAVSYLPIYWAREGVVRPNEAIGMLDGLVREGYRLSTKDYVTIKEIILKK